jgi:hypothetical protein
MGRGHPNPPGFDALVPSQVDFLLFLRKLRAVRPTLSLVRPLNRRSGCVPASPYPPLSSGAVYLNQALWHSLGAPKSKNGSLTGRALSYMGQYVENEDCIRSIICPRNQSIPVVHNVEHRPPPYQIGTSERVLEIWEIPPRAASDRRVPG